MNETYNSQNPNTGKQPRNPKESTSSERLATCSMIAGITGMICSFFYFPVSLVSGSNTPTGMICGIIGIVLAIMSRNADVSGRKSFNARAITGIVLSGLAIALTFFFFSLLGCYYEILSDPVMGPKFNEYINRIQQLMHLSGGSSWIHL